MDPHSKALRTGSAAIACAIVFRLAALWPVQVHTAPVPSETETGRDVRFSASREVFWEWESAAPLLPAQPAPEEPVLPAFSPEDAVLTDMYYACSLRPDLGALLSLPLSWNLADTEPRVLILHTHTTESYTQRKEPYVESADYRTLDESYNMLSIGSIVAGILSDNGIGVVHDRQLHDYPSYNGSYNDARKSILSYLEQFPGIELVLDLHRDAADTENGQLRPLVTLAGEAVAQLMLVMGTDESGLSHEHWQENLSLALKLQAQLERQAPGITRPTILRAQRFNQDLSPGALLVEVGAAGNTHEEARRAAEQLAHAIVALAKGTVG